MHAKDLMTGTPVHVSPETSIGKAVALMLDHRISGLPVLDEEGKLCGMLTEADLLKRSALNIARHAPPERYDAAFFQTYVESHGTTVGDCMSREVISASPETPLFDLVALMRNHNIKRLPVVDNGQLVGIVSRRDVLKAVSTGRENTATGDEALRLAVMTRLRCELGIEPQRAEVTVRDHVVTIAGPITCEAERRAICLVTESVAGVAGTVIVQHH